MSDPIKKIALKDGSIRYRFVIDIGRDPETNRRRQKTYTFEKVKEARAEYARIKNETEQGTFVPPSKLTVAQVLDIYLKDATIDVEETTANNYRDALKPVREHHGDLPAQRYDEDKVDDLVSWMLNSARKRGGQKGTGLGLRSVQLTLGRLRAAWDLAVRRKLVTRNVVEHTKIPREARRKQAERKANRVPWDQHEVKTFLAYLSGHRLEAPALLALMGVGPAELCGERWAADVDLPGKRIKVADNTRTLSWNENGGQVIEKDGKTPARKRWLPLPTRTAAGLKSLKAQQAAEKLAAGQAYIDSGYVLVDELGRPFKTDQWRRALYKLMAEAGVRKVRPYDARHSCLTYLAVSGVPDVIISAWAGHADLTTAKKFYIHPTAEDLEPAAKKLDQLFG